MVCLCRIRAYYHENAHNDAEQVCYCPPCEIWKCASDGGNDGRDEGDEPSKLSEVSVSFVSDSYGSLITWVRTYICY